MNRRIKFAIGALGALGAVAFATASKWHRAPADPSLVHAIDEAADYLCRNNDDHGRFVYRVYAGGNHEPGRKYNILRHAGAIHSLADYRGRSTDKDGRVKATMARAETYLVSKHVRALRDRPEIEAVWSDPHEEGGERQSAKLGGTALAMIALLDDKRDLARAQALGRFLLFMQQPNGDFHAKFDEEKGFDTDFESLYYPGEAILALTMLYEADHDERWLSAAARGVAHLVESRRGSSKLPNDHWLMIAIERLLPRYSDLASPPLPREDVIAHAVALGQTMIDEQNRVLASHGDAPIAGAFSKDGRTTPTATRLEGLLSLERAIANDAGRAAFRDTLRVAIGRGIAFLLRAQIHEGAARGGMPMALADVPGAEREIRIDYVQHALSAMIRYERMCTDGGTGCTLTR